MSQYQPDWDGDREFGEMGERFMRDLFGLDAEHFEVKRKRYPDDRFYVEIAQKPNGNVDFKASGINTTKADYVAYLVADTGVVVLFPRVLLKEAARRGRDVAETDGNNPTKGKLVAFDDVVRQPWRKDNAA